MKQRCTRSLSEHTHTSYEQITQTKTIQHTSTENTITEKITNTVTKKKNAALKKQCTACTGKNGLRWGVVADNDVVREARLDTLLESAAQLRSGPPQ